jgi:hypothetical protein
LVEGEKFMEDMIKRIAMGAHEVAEACVRDRLDAVVDREDRADIRVNHKARQRPQNFGRVIGLMLAAALRVGNGDNSVDCRVNSRQWLQASDELSGEASRA